jgi:hypothetical protein
VEMYFRESMMQTTVSACVLVVVLVIFVVDLSNVSWWSK